MYLSALGASRVERHELPLRLLGAGLHADALVGRKRRRRERRLERVSRLLRAPRHRARRLLALEQREQRLALEIVALPPGRIRGSRLAARVRRADKLAVGQQRGGLVRAAARACLLYTSPSPRD